MSTTLLNGIHSIAPTGEMATLTRSFDWTQTSLGPISQWPEALLILVNTILASRNPMFLWWGEELIQFYNDAYRASIRDDKHPRALGQKGRECWPEIWPIIGPQIEAVMTRGEATWNEDHLVPIFRNGKLEDVYWTYGYSPVRGASGNILGVLVVCTETTSVVLRKRELLLEKQRMADLFQQAPAFFAVLSGPDHVFELANPLYQELVGPRSVLGKPVREAVPEAVGQKFIDLLDGVYTTGVPFIGRDTPIDLARNASQPLEKRYLDFVYQPRREADGTISGIIVLGIDVTENKRAEKALLQSEKLAVVGRLASSIAHEINNPLEAVTNLIFLAQLSPPDAIRPYLDSAEVELRRIGAITNQTLRFYRQNTHPRPITGEELVSGTLPLYQGRLKNSDIRIERRDRTPREITCLDGEIRQVLSNLIGNAIDAMSPAGGRLLLRTRQATEWHTGRAGVLISVADTGPGMPMSILGRIFEPFFTTKGTAGTGLGLWISKEIVDRHQGTLKVRSRICSRSSGTVFQLFLPCEISPVVSS